MATTSKTFKTLLPETDYYWKATGADGKVADYGVVRTLAEPVRFISIDGARNMRDSGGWVAENGKRVVYGMLYRGAMLNGHAGGPMLTAEGIRQMREDLGIMTEIDLRNDGDDTGADGKHQTECFFGVKDENGINDRNYIKVGINQYDTGIKSGRNYPLFKEIFTCLSERENYPVYFHCNAGADRTGTIGFLVGALLGMNFEDLTRDFELTSTYGKRYRSKDTGTGFDGTGENASGLFQNDSNNYVNWGGLYDELMTYAAGGTLQDAAENFLTSRVGITKTQIGAIKSILLGLEREAHDEENVFATCTEGGVAVYKNGEARYVVPEKALGHDWVIGEDRAVCARCDKEAALVVAETDRDTGYDMTSLGYDDYTAINAYTGAAVAVNDGKLSITDGDYIVGEKTILVSSGDDVTMVRLSLWSLLIKNEEDLRKANDYCVSTENGQGVTARFKLVNDIELTSVWTAADAIGAKATKANNGGFVGVFDGNGKTVSGFLTEGADSALIMSLGRGGEIRDLTLKGESNDYNGSNILCSYTFGGTFENLVIEAKFKANSAKANSALLGKIGYGKAALVNDVFINNVTVIASEAVSKAVNYENSFALCEIVLNNSIAGHIKVDGLNVVGFNYYALNVTAKINKANNVKKIIEASGGVCEGLNFYNSLNEYEAA